VLPIFPAPRTAILRGEAGMGMVVPGISAMQ